MTLFNDIFLDKKDKLAFIVGCFCAFYVSILGRVYVGELIIFFLYLIMPETRNALPSYMKKIKAFLYLWIVSALVSDIYRGIPFIDSCKGVVSILFLIALLPFVYWLLKDRPARWLCFYLGSVVSTQLTYYFLTSQTEFGSAYVWRVYSYVPIVSGIAVLCYYKGSHKLSYIILLAFGLWTLFNQSRNIFLIMSMSVFILLFVDRCSNKINNAVSVFRSKLIPFFLTLLIGLVVIDYTYEYLASNGILGEYAYNKYISQKHNSKGIASGREEAFIAASLIFESPIIGYGSYAKDRTNYVYNYYVKNHLEIRPGAFDYNEDSVENMLPRHSRIFGLWMWHGIGAGIFWLYILFLIFKALRRGVFLLYPRLAGLFVLTTMSELWDTFFSPMSIRLPFLCYIVYIFLLFESEKTNETISFYCDSQL